MTLQTNSTLQGGKYRILSVIGQGGFGITYLAEHNLLGTKVAIKEFFMKDFCNREEATSHVSVVTEGGHEQVSRFRDKFLKEARNIARLHHPNIIRISDVFEENGTAYYVMDYCEGGSLADLVKLYPTGIGEARALKYIRQVASALQYIHEQNMNHLDVKPANILLDSYDNAILIDFGLSKQYDLSGGQTSTTPVGISHGYAPIEQYKQGGVKEFSPTTDIYSLGATLYKLITGETPPDAQMLIENGLPIFAASDNVIQAIRQAMQVKRTDRPQSIVEWLSILNASSSFLSSVSTESQKTNTEDVETTEIIKFAEEKKNTSGEKPQKNSSGFFYNLGLFWGAANWFAKVLFVVLLCFSAYLLFWGIVGLVDGYYNDVVLLYLLSGSSGFLSIFLISRFMKIGYVFQFLQFVLYLFLVNILTDYLIFWVLFIPIVFYLSLVHVRKKYE